MALALQLDAIPTRPKGAVGVQRRDEQPTTLQFRKKWDAPSALPRLGPTHDNSGPGHRSHSLTGDELEIPPSTLSVTTDSSRYIIAWSWTYQTSMRMLAPPCHGHRYIGVPLAPIGSERRKAPPPGFRLEGRWPTSRLFGPSDCKCDRLEHGLLVDVLDPASWSEDPRQSAYPARRAKRMLDSPRPERPVSPDGRRVEYPRGRPTPKPAPPGQGNAISRDSRVPDPLAPPPQLRPPQFHPPPSRGFSRG